MTPFRAKEDPGCTLHRSTLPLLLPVFLFAAATGGCLPQTRPAPLPPPGQPAATPGTPQAARALVSQGETPMAFTLSSTAFTEGSSIPKKYSCDGENSSPPLSWSGVPAGTKSLGPHHGRSRRS